MESLARRPIVRESDIFAALLPRGFAPKEDATRTARPLAPMFNDGDREDRSTTAAPTSSAAGDDRPRRVPTLAVLSPKTPRSLMQSVPMTAHDGALVWRFLCDWVNAQLAMEAPASIPGFGTVTQRTQALRIRVSSFEPDRSFMERHGLRTDTVLAPLNTNSVVSPSSSSGSTDSPTVSRGNTSEVLSFSYLEMASCCGKQVDATRARDWLTLVLQKTGEVMRHHPRVELNLGAGVLVCQNRIIDTHLQPRRSNDPPPIEYEVRSGESEVKRALQATNLPKSKPKHSFLVGDEFSNTISVNPAFDGLDSAQPGLFKFDFAHASPNSRVASRKVKLALPASQNTARASPRAQQLQFRLKSSTHPHRNNDDVDVQHRNSRLSPSTDASASGENPENLVDLFDPLARTLCVEPDLNVVFLTPSNRIGSNHTVSAARVVMACTVHTREAGASNEGIFLLEHVRYHGEINENPHESDPFSLATPSAQDDGGSERRYFSYVNGEVGFHDERVIMPLSEKMVERIVASAVKYLRTKPTGHIKAILASVQMECISNYNFSAKKAIMDYLLLRPATCRRLKIWNGTPSYSTLPQRWKWGDSAGVNGCLGDMKLLVTKRRSRKNIKALQFHRQKRNQRHRFGDMVESVDVSRAKTLRKRVKAKLQGTLMIGEPEICALHALWYEIENSTSLVTLPSLGDLSDSIIPMSLHRFESLQLAHAASMKTQLMDRWYRRARDLFESALENRHVPVGTSATAIDARLRHVFNAVAVQMSLQIRALIMKSIRAYVEFFELFGTSKDRSVQTLETQEQERYSGLLVSLIIQDGSVSLENAMVEIPSLLVGVLHNLPQLFHNINRIETQFENRYEGLTPPSSPFIWNVGSQEEEIMVSTIRIREIVEDNLLRLKDLLSRYVDYSHVYNHVTAPNRDEFVQTISIETCVSEMTRVSSSTNDLMSKTRDYQYLRLFCVDCRDVNATILTAMAQWTKHILLSFANRTSFLNAELRQQYKEVAARLAKRPMDLYDLVAAESFVEELKTSRLAELDKGVVEVKQRMHFLLSHRDSVANIYEGAGRSTISGHGGPSGNTSTRFRITTELLSSTAKTIRWRTHIEKLLQDAESSLIGERARIEAVFLSRRNRFQAEIEEFEAEVKGFAKKGDLRHAATYVVQLSKMKDALSGFRRQMESILEEEAKLQWKSTDFSKLDDIAEEMEPYEKLWRTAREFRELSSRWLRTNVFELVAEDGFRALQQMMATMTSVSNLLHLNSAAAAITAEMIKKQMGDFRENSRLVAAILNPSMQERHLKEVSALVGINVDRQEPVTLLKLLENGAFDHLSQIMEISDNATLEKQVDDALQAISAEWQGVSFFFKVPKSTRSSETVTDMSDTRDPDSANAKHGQTLVLHKPSVDDIKMLVEDHQLRLQSLQCMPHAIPFFQDIASWLTFFHQIYQIADLSVANERLWRRLAPLFAAGVIDDDSEEHKQFGIADRLFRSVMERIAETPTCVELVPRHLSALHQRVGSTTTTNSNTTIGSGDTTSPSPVILLADLETTRDLLEQVHATLAVGFDERRVLFPRFYFLSDDDLVSVLALQRQRSTAKDRLATKNHDALSHRADSPLLWKLVSRCFSGVASIQLNGSDEIRAFGSVLGEQVPLGTPIATNEVAITSWLGKLEASMTTILQACVRAAISDYARKEFRKWCLLWPEQVLLATVLHAWTIQGEHANNKASVAEAAAGWHHVVELIVEKISSLTKELKASATISTRTTLTNVILLLLQLRDVSRTIHSEVSALAEGDGAHDTMTWLAQPRFYYDANVFCVKVMALAPLQYGFEYQGNASPPILTTPLTLRCYHAMAMHLGTLMRGSLISGPAGSGKATIAQGLGQLCGRLLISLRCGANAHGSAAVFDDIIRNLSGIANCGGWIVFHEAQALALERLSALALICSQVMNAAAAHHATCTILDTKVKMKRGVQFLVVDSTPMAAASAHGSSTLRDRVQFAFYPVELVEPDIGRLAEFFLAEARFLFAPPLARVIEAVLKCCSRAMYLITDQQAPRELFNSIKAVRKVVSTAAALAPRERTALQQLHGISPQLLSIAPWSDGKMSELGPDAAREIEKMEYGLVCTALRDFASSVVPEVSLEWIDGVLRDVVLISRQHKPIGQQPTMRGFNVFESKDRTSPNSSVTDGIAAFVETAEPASLEYGTRFTAKVIQLYQALRDSSVVAIVGGPQSGKTSLQTVLARALEHTGEVNEYSTETPPLAIASRTEVHRTVICPRSLTHSQLLGDKGERFHVNTVVTQSIRDAKNAGPVVQSWLVLDGDLDATWAEPMLLAADRLTTARGYLLPSGKHMSIPESMRLIFETTTLSSISPAFLTKLSLVHVGFDNAQVDWKRSLSAWKRRHTEEFSPDPFRSELFDLLDVLCDETIDACCAFVRENFETPHPSSVRWRLCSFFNMLRSFLLQSWAKMCAMVSGKQRKTAIHCFFLQALVWGIGHTADRTERAKFHTFLRQHIVHGPKSADSSLKRVLILFFPSGTMGTGTATSLGLKRSDSASSGLTSSAGASSLAPKETIYSFGFSADFGLKWMRWPDFFDHWFQARNEFLESRRGSRSANLFSTQGRRGSVSGTGAGGASAATSSGISASPSLSETVFAVPDACGNALVVVRTPAVAKAISLIEPLLAAGYAPLLMGPRDVGKTTIGRVYLELSATGLQSQNITTTGSSSASAGSTTSALSDQDASVRRHEWVYMGPSITATDVLEQLQNFLERRRLRRRRNSMASNAAEPPLPSSPMVVFFDDVHCARVGVASNSALELFRALVEHRQVVHPTAAVIMPCTDMNLLASISTRGGRADAEMSRAVARCVPIAIASFTDADLSSICSSVLTSVLHQDRHGDEDQTVELSYSAAQEISQLQSILLKSSIKLYRILTSDTWMLQATGPGSSASAAAAANAMTHSYRHFAAHSAFAPAKAHYRFHTKLILEVLRSVCGHTRINLTLSEKPLLARLWCHESARVYGDRLVDADDSKLFYQLLQDIATTHFVLTPDAIMASAASSSDGRSSAHSSTSSSSLATWLQHHANFTFIGESSGAGMIDGYREVYELQKVELSIERSMMAMYRANVLTESLELALCPYVIQHIFRLTRVLRHADTHLLLLGSLGRKMQTITRLAAFICRKTTVTFHVPRLTEDPSTLKVVDAWKRTLRHALLQCICKPEDPIVLIVKDWWLECDAIYGIIDRYLSGATKLLSDVIHYDDLDESILTFLRDESERDRRDQLARRQSSADSSSPSSTLVGESASLLLHSKSAVMEFFFRCVRRRFQLALIVSAPPSLSRGSTTSATRMASLLTRYPHIQSNTTIDYFSEWPDESLQVIAEKCFAPTFTTEKDRLVQLSQAAVGVFGRTRAEFEKWSCTVVDGSVGSQAVDGTTTGKSDKGDCLTWFDRQVAAFAIEPSVMVEQISLFTTYWPRLQREVEATKAKYEGGLDFIARTEQMLVVEQSQQQILQPEMEKRTAVTRRMSGNLEKEKLTAVKLVKALEMEATMVETQRERLQLVEREYDDLVRESRSAFELKCAAMLVFLEAVSQSEDVFAANSAGEESSTSNISAVEESESRSGSSPHDAAARRLRCFLIKSFVSMLHVPTSIRQLAECLGVIFGIEPMQVRDELDPDEIVLDYWESVAARLQTPDFWGAMVHFDMRRRMNEQVVARVLPICTAPDFEPSMFSAIHELAGVLCEWVQSCAAFARDFVLAEPKFSQLSHERAAYTGAVAQLKAREAEIQAQANATTQVHAMRELSEQERKEIEDKLKDNSSTLQITTSVWNVLQSSKRRWRESLDRYTEFNVQAMGDLLLATAAVVYGGALTARARSALRVLWSDELNQRFLMHSPCHSPRSLSNALLVDPRTLARWTMDGIPAHDPVALDNAVILSHSFLLPFIIDPYGIASEWIAKQEAGSGFRRVSASTRESEELWQDVVRSIKKKRSLMIESVDERALNNLLSLVQAKRRTRFDVVNRDLSTLANTVATYSSPTPVHRTDGSSAGHHIEGASSMRRISSVGIGLGISPITASSSAAMNFHGSHRCWLQVPSSDGSGAGTQASASGDESTTDSHSSILEFSSEACRIYLVYSQSDELPAWIAPLSSQLSVVRFEFSLAFVASKTTDTILERHHSTHVLTEIQTLQLDVLSCEEQMETIENEILDFFSVEQPAVVYADAAKALKIIGNRSSLHTLESSKLDSLSKIRALHEQLTKYDPLIARAIDVALVWRDCLGMATMQCQTSSACETDVAGVFPLQWLWMVLSRALDAVPPEAIITDAGVTLFTTRIRQCVEQAVSDGDRLLFDFLLAFRVHHRRSRVAVSIDREHTAILLSSSLTSDESSLLRRLVMLLETTTDAQLKVVTSSVSSKLVTVRPDGLSAQKWRALCFLAEQHKSLREWIMRTHEVIQQQCQTKSPTNASNKDLWKEALALTNSSDASLASASSPSISSSNGSGWPSLSSIGRLCVAAALFRHQFLHEIEIFVVEELGEAIERESIRSGAAESVENIPDAQDSCQTEAIDSAHQTGSDPEPVNDAQTTDIASAQEQVKLPDPSDTAQELWLSYAHLDVPIVLAAAPATDVVEEIAKAVARSGVMIDTSAVDAVSEEAFKASLILAIQKGHWFVISDADALPRSRVHIVRQVLASIHEQTPHTDFRLWLSARRHPQQQQRRSNIGIAERLGAPPHSLVKSLQPPFAFKRTLQQTIEHVQRHPVYELLVPETEANGSSVRCMLRWSLKRIAIFHTAMLSNDHFGFAQYRQLALFSNDALRSALQAFARVIESEQLLVGAKAARSTIWEYQRVVHLVRSLLFTLYTAGIRLPSDRDLIRCLLELLFPLGNPPSQDAREGDADGWIMPRIATEQQMDAGCKVVPDVVFAAETLDAVAWSGLHAQVEALWTSDELGLSARDQDLVMTDSTLQRTIRRRGFARQLRWALEYQGVMTTLSRWSKRAAPQAPQAAQLGARPSTGSSLIHRTALCLDSLLRFASELDGFPLLYDTKLLAERHPCEYKRPLDNVLHHEIRNLISVREAILSDIRHLQAVSHGIEAATQDDREQFEALLRSETPLSWLAYLPFLPQRVAELRGGGHSVSLDTFQTCVIERLKYFSNWIEQGAPTRLAMDKFQSCEYVLEAIHQHVLRNFVGATVCSSNCLQVVRILEDRPQLSFVGARDGAFFLSGWRVMGHLQLDIHAAGGTTGASPERKRSQPVARSVAHDLSRLHFHGTPVVLEITTKCLSPLDGPASANPPASLPSMRPSTSGSAGAQDRVPVVNQIEFVCPVWRTLSVADHSDDGDGPDLATDRKTHTLDRAPEAYLSIASNLSLAQHAFSGSSLRIVICPESSSDAAVIG